MEEAEGKRNFVILNLRRISTSTSDKVTLLYSLVLLPLYSECSVLGRKWCAWGAQASCLLVPSVRHHTSILSQNTAFAFAIKA
jgi:hypothetical protein